MNLNSVFHIFIQANFAFDGLILRSSFFSLLLQGPQKNGARFKSGQKWFKNNNLATLI